MRRFRNILAVCDGQGVSASLYERLRWLSSANGAQVTLLEVLEAGPGPIARYLSGLPESRAEELRRRMDEAHAARLSDLADPLRSAGADVRCAVDHGTAFLEIIRRVIRDGHDLVLKDGEGRSGWPVLGGVDMPLLRKCPCPVWILSAPAGPKSRRILAAVDTQSGEPAHDGLNRTILDLATSLAEQDGAEVDVVAAWCVPEEWTISHGRLRLPQEEVRAILAQEEGRSAERLSALIQAFPHHLGRLNVHHLKGRAAHVLAQHVEDRRIDTLVMGTVGRVGVAGFFIGNTAETLLGRVACSVLAVKPAGFVSPVAVESADRPTPA